MSVPRRREKKLWTLLHKSHTKKCSTIESRVWFFIFYNIWQSKDLRTNHEDPYEFWTHRTNLWNISILKRILEAESEEYLISGDPSNCPTLLKNNKTDCLKLGRRRKSTRLFFRFDRCSISQIHVIHTGICMLVLVCVHVCIYVCACVCAYIHVRNIHI